MSAALPTHFGPYRVLRALASGGMGAVLEVEGPHGGARLALKTLLPGAGPIEHERLRREAEALGRLDHPHVVRVHAADLDVRPPWIVLDLLPGGSLEERLRRGPLPVDEALQLAAKVARATAHAHARGLLHRDLKPLNVLFDDRGEPRLVDFGLTRSDSAQRLTTTGELLGTPAYMAPEQAVGAGEVDARTDVYGLGGVLFAALVGRPPFTGTSTMAVLSDVMSTDPPRVSALRPGVPEAVSDVVARALAKAPGDRFPDAAAFAAQVEALGRAPSASAHARSAEAGEEAPRARLVPALVAAATLALGGLALAVALAPRGEPAPATPVAPPRRTSPPRLTLSAPLAGAQVERDVVRVEGRVEDDGPTVTVSVGETSARVPPGAFALDVPLSGAPGPRILRVRVQDEDERSTSAEVSVAYAPIRGAGASWFVELPAGRRPRTLPPGVELGPAPGEYVLVKNDARIPLVWIPPGGVSDRPVKRGFFLGKRELSWGELRASRADVPAQMTADERPELPVHSLVPDQSEAVCRHLGARLPTAAEWLWAARGPDLLRFPWGNDPPVVTPDVPDPRANVGWSGRRESYPTPVEPVGRAASASPFGCEDMVGNVAEHLDPGSEPCAPNQALSIGGSWSRPVDALEVDPRAAVANHNVGLRIALTAE